MEYQDFYSETSIDLYSIVNMLVISVGTENVTRLTIQADRLFELPSQTYQNIEIEQKEYTPSPEMTECWGVHFITPNSDLFISVNNENIVTVDFYHDRCIYYSEALLKVLKDLGYKYAVYTDRNSFKLKEIKHSSWSNEKWQGEEWFKNISSPWWKRLFN